MLRAASSERIGAFHRRDSSMAEKQLESTVRAAAYQKAWFAQLREDVFEKQKPYAIVQADMPLELFHAMDVPVVSNQWWAAMVVCQAAGALLSRWSQRPGLSRRVVPLLQPVACVHYRRRSGASALGRPAKARAPFRPTHLRLHPACFRNLGGQVRQSIRSSGCSRRVRTSAALVGAEPSSLERALRKPSAGFHGGAVSFAHRGPWNESRETAFDIEPLARFDGRRQPAGAVLRRSPRDDLPGAQDAGPDARADEQRDGGAVAARQRLGDCVTLARFAMK